MVIDMSCDSQIVKNQKLFQCYYLQMKIKSPSAMLDVHSSYYQLLIITQYELFSR